MLIEQHRFLVCSQQEKNRDKVTTKIKDKYFRPSYDGLARLVCSFWVKYHKQKDTYRLEPETAAQLPSTHLIPIFSNRETRSTVKTS